MCFKQLRNEVKLNLFPFYVVFTVKMLTFPCSFPCSLQSLALHTLLFFSRRVIFEIFDDSAQFYLISILLFNTRFIHFIIINVMIIIFLLLYEKRTENCQEKSCGGGVLFKNKNQSAISITAVGCVCFVEH